MESWEELNLRKRIELIIRVRKASSLVANSVYQKIEKRIQFAYQQKPVLICVLKNFFQSLDRKGIFSHVIKEIKDNHQNRFQFSKTIRGGIQVQCIDSKETASLHNLPYEQLIKYYFTKSPKNLTNQRNTILASAPGRRHSTSTIHNNNNINSPLQTNRVSEVHSEPRIVSQSSLFNQESLPSSLNFNSIQNDNNNDNNYNTNSSKRYQLQILNKELEFTKRENINLNEQILHLKEQLAFSQQILKDQLNK